MTKILQNNGFVKPVITPDHYVLGGGMVPKVTLRPDRQWLGFLPPGEKQFTPSFDTYGCTVFGTLNALEILSYVVTDKIEEKSDRFTYIVSNTHPPGNDPHVIAQTIKNVGVVPDADFPFSSDIDSLYAFTDITDVNEQKLDKEASAWLDAFTFMHEWVIEGDLALAEKQKRLWESLQYSPLGASVHAWVTNERGLYCKDLGTQDNHWTVIVGGVFGEYWIIFDSYPDDQGSFIKKLEWDYDFGFAKRYYLTTKTPIGSAPEPKTNWLAGLVGFIMRLIAKIKP